MQQQHDELQTLATLAIPKGSRVLLVGLKPDEGILPGTEVWSFPCDANGSSIPYLPPDDCWAIERLEELRVHVRYLLIPSHEFWWLEHYRLFAEHLEKHGRVIAGLDDVGLVVDLKPLDRSGRPRLTLNGPVLSSEEQSFPHGTVWFQCNVCGASNRRVANDLTREGASCTRCGSSVRWRSVVHTLSVELFQKSLNLAHFPRRPDLVGIGLSDWGGYAQPLAEHLGYRNTFYHQAPFLDITHPDRDLDGTCDFLISSDVFEHVPPPVSRAFEQARCLLKPDGVLILTVPYLRTGETIEHFPNLYRYEIVEQNGRRMLSNITREGRVERFERLVFHGGPGETLEMRTFTEASLLRALAEAGFANVRVHAECVPQRGIFWNAEGSYPISARAE